MNRRLAFAVYQGLILALVVHTQCFAQVAIKTVAVGTDPITAATNAATNKTYVLNRLCDRLPCSVPGTVTVIDGAANTATATVTVGFTPAFIGVNSSTNKIYVTNECGNDSTCNSPGTVTVIDGNTLAVSSVNVGYDPGRLAINPLTNRIYVVNQCAGPAFPYCQLITIGTVTVINGATLATQNVTVDYGPRDVAVNPATNTIYVANSTDIASGVLTVINGNNLSTQQVRLGLAGTSRIAIDPTRNKIYVLAVCGFDINSCYQGTVDVLDGATLAQHTVNVYYSPTSIGVNTVTNMVYVGNSCMDSSCWTQPSLSVIDGSTLSSSWMFVCTFMQGIDAPADIEINQTTNQIFMPCRRGLSHFGGHVVDVIDGATNTITPVAVGDSAYPAALNEATNTLYVPNYVDGTVSVIGGHSKLQLASIPPCRLVDTRPGSGSGPIPGGTSQTFNLPQLAHDRGCASLDFAAAYSLNVTMVPVDSHPVRYLSIWPAGQVQQVISTMNSQDGRTKANAAIVGAGVNGGVTIYVTDTANVIVDTDGAFVPSDSSTLGFYPITPCRVADTRNSTYPPGLGTPHLTGQNARDFPILTSPCIPQGVQPAAYSLNVTAVAYPSGGHKLNYLELWPTGQQPQNPVSTLNNPTGTNVANAAIVPAGTGGEVTAYASNDTDFIIDINGYFAAPGSGGLSFYPAFPCRVIDTRNNDGQPFNGVLAPPVDVVNAFCGMPSSGQAYTLNATVVPQPVLGYLTLWSNGEPRPEVSTLNASDGSVASNMAIVPTTDGKIDAYANGLTHLILDISGYFAP